MFIETKFNFTPGRIGKFFAEELNILVDELQNIVKLFANPSRTSSTQIVEAVIGAGTLSFFETSLLNNRYTVYRSALPDILQHPHVGTCGYFIPPYSNTKPLPVMVFGNGAVTEMRLRGKTINTGDIISSEVYMFIYREDNIDSGYTASKKKYYFDIYPISITGDVIIANNAGTTVTTDKLEIDSDNRVTLPSRPNGDIMMGTVKIYDVENTNTHAPYDASVVEGSNIVQIHADERMTGKFAMVSYTL